MHSLKITVAAILMLTIGWTQIPTPDMFEAFDELEGKLTLLFFNALNGQPIPDAGVVIEGVGEFVTDANGRALFPIPPDSVYDVSFSKEGFVESRFKIEIAAGTIFFNRFSVSPRLEFGALRVVLDWEANPRDLDAHLVKVGKYHISFHDKRISDDRLARLDRDDTDGYGPETITANKVDDDAVYVYFVHDFTNYGKVNSDNLSRSRAVVKVFGNDQLLQVISIPRKIPGNYWQVFRIEKGELKVMNTIMDKLTY